MSTSHDPKPIVFRTYPRRWAHHVYSTDACNSAATRSASLFSNPSSRLFENGRLFGSAQTRSTRAFSPLSGGPERPALRLHAIVAATTITNPKSQIPNPDTVR